MRNLLATQSTINLGVPANSGFTNITNLQFSQVVSAAIQIVLVVAAIIFFFMLVLGGLKWITSGGDKGKTEGARSQITAALVGLVIVFAAWAIVQLIEAFFGVSILSGLDILEAGA